MEFSSDDVANEPTCCYKMCGKYLVTHFVSLSMLMKKRLYYSCFEISRYFNCA